jgi:Sad1 / UNC-like C-terminal
MLYKDGYKSAPRDIEVLHAKEIVGRFVLDPEVAIGELRLELFKPVDKLTFRILSNWGNDDWTCIYKIEVFGME